LIGDIANGPDPKKIARIDADAGLVFRDRYQRRRIDHDHLGNPCSS
jgi:hypothetical protein